MQVNLFFFILSGLLFAGSVWGKEDTSKFDSLVTEIDTCIFSRATRARMLVSELQSISGKYPDNISWAAQSLYWDAKVNCLHDISDSVLTAKVLTAIDTWELKQHPFEKALLDNALALCYLADGDYAKAFAIALQVLEQFHRLENKSAYIVRTLNLLGNICLKTQNLEMAIDYYKQALSQSDPKLREYYSILVVLYTHLSNMNPQSSYTDSLEALLPILKQKRDTVLLITTYFNLGTLFINAGDMDKGYDYYQISRRYAKEHNLDNQAFTFMSQYNFSAICQMKGDLFEAFRCAYLAKKATDESYNSEQLLMIYSLLSRLHKDAGNIDSAYFYLDKHQVLQQEFIHNSNITGVYKDYISMYLESAQKELTITEQQAVIRHKQFILLFVLAVTIISVIILLMIIVLQKRRAMGKRLEQEKQIQRLQKEKMEMQECELTSYSMLLSNKNYTFQQIQELIKQLPSSGEKDMSEIKKKITTIIKTNLETDDDKDNFMLHFNKVHPNFFEKLKARSADLTEHNLHLCAYFRIGLSSKQIAQILGISFDTIRINRYRLRKKLNLSEDEDLYDFLRNI